MNTELRVKRDERTVAVENAAFKWAYSFGLCHSLHFPRLRAMLSEADSLKGAQR